MIISNPFLGGGEPQLAHAQIVDDQQEISGQGN
jgi:hypothetical protein